MEHLYSPKWQQTKRKYKQTNSLNKTLNTDYVQSQNITVLTKYIDRIIALTNK